MITTTLCYILNNKNEVLLQYKARGFGIGKWNAPGGKVEDNETPEEGMVREVAEETSINVIEHKFLGKLDFVFNNKTDWNNQTHLFLANVWDGKPKPSQEGALAWFNVNDLPFDEMWEDDRIWLRDVLCGIPTRYRFYFDFEGKLLGFKNLIYNYKDNE